MESDNEARFAVYDKPNVMFNPGNLHHRFIRVPLIRVEIQQWQELDPLIVKEWSEAGAPIGDGGMGNLDVE